MPDETTTEFIARADGQLIDSRTQLTRSREPVVHHRSRQRPTVGAGRLWWSCVSGPPQRRSKHVDHDCPARHHRTAATPDRSGGTGLPRRRGPRVQRPADASRSVPALAAHGRPGPREGRGHGPLPHRHPRRARRLAGQAVAAVRARPRGRRHRRRARPRRHRGRARRPRRDAVARLRLRHVRPLRVRLGDAVPRAEEHGLLDRRHVRRVRDRLRPLRRQGARGHRPVRRGAVDVRGRDDLQGRQGRGHALVAISSRSSASAAWAISRSSTPRSPAGA